MVLLGVRRLGRARPHGERHGALGAPVLPELRREGGPMLARAALAAVLVPLGIVCWVSLGEVRRCR